MDAMGNLYIAYTGNARIRGVASGATVIATPPDAIADGSFETPVLAAGTWQLSPSGSPWQFSGKAGLTGNQSPFTAANPSAPDGTQVA